MNNADIAVGLAAKFGISKTDAKKYVDETFTIVSDAAGRGDEISVNGFGKFKVKDIAAREGRNPKTGEVVQIGASKKLAFSASKTLKDKLNG